ncbi:MAG: HlyC/CorC family transporter [Lachnospiraceae bacterium]|nr:HlyC/CorC family transporter [Lachnospiraceae bacterium]
MTARWICLVILILLSAFFSSAETALTTVSRIRMRTLAEKGDRRAKRVQKIHEHYSKMLTSILVGNNIVNVAASALATTVAISIGLNVGIMTAVLTLVLLVFGEITPKNAAAVSPDRFSLAYSGVIYVLMIILTPVIWIIDKLCRALAFVMRIDIDNPGESMTEGELRTIVDVSHENGVIETEEKQIIKNVFDFGDCRARDIMIPRIDVVSVSFDTGYAEIRDIFEEEKYSRLPVYKDDTDNIIGIINLKDFFLASDTESFRLRDIMRDAYYTFEMKKTSELMIEMKQESVSMAIVLNEYGAAEGIITMEDLLEEIVGEIRDEYDEDEKELITSVGRNEYIVEGSIKLDDLNDEIGTDFKSEDYDSIGGYMIGLLDRIPEAGETVFDEEGIRLEAQTIIKNRIDKIHITIPENKKNDESA